MARHVVNRTLRLQSESLFRHYIRPIVSFTRVIGTAGIDIIINALCTNVSHLILTLVVFVSFFVIDSITFFVIDSITFCVNYY